MHVIASSMVGLGKVYNLTVSQHHEYFANGILVSNCDALRYVIAARPQAPGAPVSMGYPVGTAGWLKQQLMAGTGRQVLGADAVRRRAYGY